MLLPALMIHVRVLTHVCWPDSCNNLGHDCPPLFISAAEGMCPCISVPLAQSTAVSHKYFHPLLTLMCQNGKQSRVLHRFGPAVLPGWLLAGEGGLAAGTSGNLSCHGHAPRAPQSEPFGSVGLWRMAHVFKKITNRFVQSSEASSAIQGKHSHALCHTLLDRC